MKNITEADRKKIKRAMKKKIREMNGKAINKIELINREFDKEVAARRYKIYATDIMREAGVIPEKYNNIVHGIIRVKDLNYEKLVNYFEL